MVCLSRANRSNWASICASTAIRTYIRVNHIDIPRRNSFNGTFIDTRTASSTIFTNFVSHCFRFFMVRSCKNNYFPHNNDRNSNKKRRLDICITFFYLPSPCYQLETKFPDLFRNLLHITDI